MGEMRSAAMVTPPSSGCPKTFAAPGLQAQLPGSGFEDKRNRPFRKRTLDDCAALVNEWGAAALSEKPDAIILVHGGPVAMPEDAEYILKRTKNCQGFYGASSMERLPTEAAIIEQCRKFKSIRRVDRCS
mgnify:CR=1 FL=1|jgi:hypothetical protein